MKLSVANRTFSDAFNALIEQSIYDIIGKNFGALLKSIVGKFKSIIIRVCNINMNSLIIDSGTY